MLSRRNMLGKFGLGVIAAPVVISSMATAVVGDVCSPIEEIQSPIGTEIIGEEKTLEYHQADYLPKGEKLTHFQQFSGRDTPVIPGDIMNAKHSVELTWNSSLIRDRRFLIHCALVARGVCVEGLVIEDGEQLRLATKQEVTVESDSHDGITPEAWMEELASLMLKAIGHQNVSNTA